MVNPEVVEKRNGAFRNSLLLQRSEGPGQRHRFSRSDLAPECSVDLRLPR